MHVPWPRVWKLWRWAHSFSEQSCWWNSSALLAHDPCQRSYACPIALCLHTAWQVLGAHFFGAIQLMKFVLKTHANSSRFSLYRYAALPKLFPTVSRPSTMSTLPCRSLPTELSPSYFPWFPVRPPCPRFCVAPPAAKQTKREPKHRRCFWKKEHHWPKKIQQIYPPKIVRGLLNPSVVCFFALLRSENANLRGMVPPGMPGMPPGMPPPGMPGGSAGK